MDFTLTPEQLNWQRVARDFVERDIKPDILRREKIVDPDERMPWDWIREASRLGLRTLAFPRDFGGGGGNVVTLCLVAEELAVGDLGFAIFMDQVYKLSYFFIDAMTDEQRDRFLPPFMNDPVGLLCVAFTEPDAGSDHQSYYTGTEIDFRTVAIRDGDSYVLNGVKSFPSNIGVANFYFIGARTDPNKSLRESGSVFMVPADTPGLFPGKVWKKLGQRMSVNADLEIRDCRVPAENLLLGEGRMFELRANYMPGAKPETAALNVGLARAAFEEATVYAKERVQGGKPIIEHQAIATMLADMAIKIESARRMVLHAAWLSDKRDPQAGVSGLLAKVYSCEIAWDVARQAMEVLGARGIMQDRPLEKLFRDASTLFHNDGTNQMALLRSAQVLAGARSAETVGGF